MIKNKYKSKIKDPLKNVYIKPSLGLTTEDLYGISVKEINIFNKQIDKNRKKNK
jgi:hypothetical protein